MQNAPSHEGDFERLVHILYGFDFARWRQVDNFADDLLDRLTVWAAVLAHGVARVLDETFSAPEILKPIRSQLGVTHRVLDVLVPEPGL